MSASPYLTVKEAAAVLGISDDGVRKLIRRQKLRAIKRSERRTLIPRPAFDAYLRAVNGTAPPPLGRTRPETDLQQRVAEFVQLTGSEPRDWLARWASDDALNDEGSNMEITVSAVALLAEQREARAAPERPVARS